ncbi:DUF488 domain-containing protein [Paenibacillus sp. NFR01]|uniref:DUF488 domain-containing protein n=1 Tax=Paenibacillus sp. NFR01 TaxID=1566279 RepID=UPI000B8A5D9B|nr:DUF488 domain-containing protein [Paenibacillus sp. NFR01]
MKERVRIKRIYDPTEATDGRRVLVDRLWPRGVSRERAAIDEWMKELAPSPELRQWFCHQPERFEVFALQYAQELDTNANALSLAELLAERSHTEPVTLLYAAKDPEHNHAIVLRTWLINYIKHK